MSEVQLETLFDEYATCYLRGERPDVREYLERAGAEREELGRLLDRFLEGVPAREPTEEDVVLVQARLEQQPPLLVLRLRQKLSRGAVVDAIVSTLGLDPAKREKVASYYHELEIGILDPKPVSTRVWDTIGAFLHANVRVLAGLRPPPPAAEAALFRRADADYVRYSLGQAAAATSPAEPLPERDEIDALFLGRDTS